MGWFSRKIAKPYVRSVQKSAAAAGGSLSYDFSQCLDPVDSIIAKHPATAAGICELLSAKWIDELAHGRSLQAWLAGAGGVIDPSKIRMLMQLFVVGETMQPEMMIDARSRGPGTRYNGNTTQQTKATANYLMSKGVVLLDNRATFEAWRTGQDGGGEKIKHGLSDAIISGSTTGANFRTLGIWGTGGGHAMASYKNGTAIKFFDPNFGEYSFSDRQAFKSWFTETFYPKSGYTKLLGNSYEVYRYVKN